MSDEKNSRYEKYLARQVKKEQEKQSEQEKVDKKRLIGWSINLNEPIYEKLHDSN